MNQARRPTNPSEVESFAARIKWVSNSTKAHIRADLLLRLVGRLKDCWDEIEQCEKGKNATQTHIKVLVIGLENRARSLWFEIEGIIHSIMCTEGGRLGKRTKNLGILAALKQKRAKKPNATALEIWLSFPRIQEDSFTIEVADGSGGSWTYHLWVDVPARRERNPEKTRLYWHLEDTGRRGDIAYSTFKNNYWRCTSRGDSAAKNTTSAGLCR